MPQPIKKRKRGDAVTNDTKGTRQKIKTLEASLSDKANLNNLVELLELARNETAAEITHSAIHALHRVFSRLLLNGDMKRPKSQDTSSKATVTSWLREQYNDYLKMLRSLLSHEEPGLQVPALNILMALLKSHSEFSFIQTKQCKFANDFYGPVVEAVIQNRNLSQPLFNEFLEKYVNVYDDLRHYFYKDTAELIEAAMKKRETEAPSAKKKRRTVGSAQDLSQLAQNIFSIVESIRTMPTEESEIDEFWTQNPSSQKSKKKDDSEDIDGMDDLLGDAGLLSEEDEDNEEKGEGLQKKEKKHPLLQLKVHQREFSQCWIKLLKLPLTEEIYKKTLLILHKRVLPHMIEPKMLMDFLTDSYNVGGAVSLLALNGLFTLITEHNLDYPDFYHKLYNLLDRNVMHVKYRSRFFRLLDIFLSSAYLPAALVAAFIKRMARLSLTAPPAASVTVIPFIYNLLKRHPTCMKMIHNSAAIGQAEDPYLVEEKNPYEAKALDSSLWEVQTLAQHYYANVSTMAKIFSEQFLKPKYNLEDFLDHTYSTLFNNETERKRKKDPALAFEKPVSCQWEI
ncbi:hypothetical protein DFQ28_002981 [Apophysomyces sp. BC1034]|nr:hypothetical protein DFQ30_006454 [Apophysomyces sp. BC1015]KAG0176416.1 hypothetical protein DFQ29_006164 [Apophysomyces sp. BC1021]KAG0193829.1 hypothetical protein DFQ28_002981 [Apophysomyces sp. BC1034]